MISGLALLMMGRLVSLAGVTWLQARPLVLSSLLRGWAGAVERINEFVHKVVVHRRDSAVRVWRNLVMEDPLVHPKRWLRPDLVPPAPFLNFDPEVTVDGSGVLVEPAAINEDCRMAWIPFFCRGHKGSAHLGSFMAVAEALTPLLVWKGRGLRRCPHPRCWRSRTGFP